MIFFLLLFLSLFVKFTAAILVIVAFLFLVNEPFPQSLLGVAMNGIAVFILFRLASSIDKYNVSRLAEKQVEFSPELAPDEGYAPMEDPRGNEAAQPPEQWLAGNDTQKVSLDSIQTQHGRFAVEMLLNKKLGAMAIRVDGHFCRLATSLIHSDVYNSGTSHYQCKRPESHVVLTHELFAMPPEKLSNGKFTFNQHDNCWLMTWSKMESGEVYNTVVYDHLNCTLLLDPEKRTGSFIISTSTDTTT